MAEVELDPRWDAYIEWLCTAPAERVPPTKERYAEEVAQVHITTLRRWESKDLFKRAWRKGADEVVGSPERTQSVLDTMYRRAMEGDVKAAQLYLTATGKMQPSKLVIEDSRSAKDLSDEELAALAAQAAAGEQERRKGHLSLVQ